MNKNEDIKAFAKEKGVYHYEIAKKLGIRDTKFSVMLRDELTPMKKVKLKRIIEEIAKEKQEEHEQVSDEEQG